MYGGAYFGDFIGAWMGGAGAPAFTPPLEVNYDRWLRIPAESRVHVVEPESRVLCVQGESRVLIQGE